MGRRRDMSRENDYKKNGVFYSLFLEAKRKYCSPIEKFGIAHEHKIFKGCNDIKKF